MGDQDYIRGYSGIVVASNFDAVVFRFHFDGELAHAIAVSEVCYDVEGDIQNLFTCESFCPDDLVYFDAIFDPSTELPDVWKVGVAWTNSKPKYNILDIDENEEEILQLYDDCWKYECLLNGDSGIPDKHYDYEVDALEFLVLELRKELRRNVLFDLFGNELEDLMDDADQNISDYVDKCYGSVMDFIEYHSEVFRVNKYNKIFTCKDAKLNDYLENTLPEKIKND